MLQQWTARGWESCSVKWLFATHSSNLTRPSFELRVGPVDRQRFLLSLQKLSTLEEFLHSPKALQLHKESSRGRGHRDFVCLSLCCSHHLSQPKPLTQRMPYPEYPTLSAHWGCHKNVEFCLPREMRRHWLSGQVCSQFTALQWGIHRSHLQGWNYEIQEESWVGGNSTSYSYKNNPLLNEVLSVKKRKLYLQNVFWSFFLRYFWGIFSLHTYC